MAIKRFFHPILFSTALFIWLALPQIAYAFSGSGSGTPSSPYLITTCDQWIEMNDDKIATYKLEVDLNCTSKGNAIFIGGLNSFDGTLQGNNHSITFALTDTGEDYQGLFTHTYGATISDLTIAGTIDGDQYVGGLIGSCLSSTLTNITSSVAVTGARNNVGGIAGSSGESTLTNIHASGNVTGPDYVGGLIGSAHSTTVTDSSTVGKVIGNDYVGGFFGEMIEGTATDSWATGNVEGNNNVAGFVGQTYYDTATPTIERCYSTGNILATGNEIGGFVGDADSVIINQSYSSGSVESTGSDVGGFAGVVDVSTINNAYAKGSVTGNNGVGGFVGNYYDGDEIKNSYSTGFVTGNNSVGGFLGYLDSGDIYSSFWDTLTSGWATSNGSEVGKTTTNMKALATFTTELGSDSWNFDTIWDINPSKNDGYPFFRWQTFNPSQNNSSSTSSNSSSNNPGPASPTNCLENPPQSYPDLFELRTGQTTVNLFFTPVLQTNQYFISYATTPNAEAHGVLVNLSSDGVQQFLIENLKPNTHYYFKVRGQYGCATGNWSDIKKIKTSSKNNQLAVPPDNVLTKTELSPPTLPTNISPLPKTQATPPIPPAQSQQKSLIKIIQDFFKRLLISR